MSRTKIKMADGGWRDATWQEEYGMRATFAHPPQRDTVQYVKWLEKRITALEEKLEALTGKSEDV